MGEIKVPIELENFVDHSLFRRKKIEASAVRKYNTTALVDTGAVLLVLPQDIVEKLDLDILKTVIVTYADERKDERPLASGVLIKIGDRWMVTDCIVGPPASEPLIGQIVLEELDLIADCQRKALTPRPESPIYPSLKMK